MKKLHNTDIPKFYTFVDNNNRFVKDFDDVFEIEKAARRPFRGYWYPNKHREISHKKADALHERNIIRGKNLNKIKAAYSIKERVTSSGEIYYDHHMLGYWRYIRTYGIHRNVAGVEHEEGEPKFRGKRSRKAIPTVWDDRSNGVYSNEKSWKHNSKRRKQWKPKPHLIEVGS